MAKLSPISRSRTAGNAFSVQTSKAEPSATAVAAPRPASLFDPNDTNLIPAEAAGFLRCSAKTLERWRRTGEGPPFVALGRGKVLYRRSDLLAFQADRVVTNTAAARQKRRP